MKDKINLKLSAILDAQNVATLLTKEELRSIGQEISRGIKDDLDSRAGWEKDIDQWIELAAQVNDNKSFPWTGSSNVKYPILTIAAMQFAARAYSALIPGPNIVQGKVIGYDKDGKKSKRASRVGKHMSYQLKYQMDNWEQDHDRLLHVLPIAGTSFKKTYFDSTKQKNVSEFIHPKDLIVNYYASSLEDSYRNTHILYYTNNEMYEQMALGDWVKPEYELSFVKRDKKKVNADTTQNIRSSSEGDTVAEFYECHTYLDLDGDGYEEPYMVTLHKSTEQIVRIFPRFKEKDIQYVPASEKVLRIYCKEFFTGYIFIPDPNSGVYGLGFGALLGPLNLSVNTIINQLVDAGTLSVLQGGFLSSNLQLTAGNMEWEPGEWKIVNSYGNDIRQSIVPLPAAPPSTVLLSLLQLLEQASMKIASVTDILSGEVPGQNTKATVAMNAVEQGLKLFTSIYKRCHTAQSKEMLKIQRLNAEYLNEREYLDILDTEVDGGQEIHRNDYNMDDYDIILSADPNVSSDQQRLLKVQALFDVLPLGAVNPTEVTKQYLEATEQPNVEQLMTMPPARPNPELVMQEVELKHKISKESEELVHRKRMEYWDRQLRSIEVDLKALDTRTTAILNLAKAEGEEEGRQLGELRNYLDQVRAQEEQLMQKKRDVIDQQFKEEQVALQREQAAAQQQQQNNNQQQ